MIGVSGGFVSGGQLITFGFHCQGDAVKDPELFVEGVELGLEALRKAKPANSEVRKRKPTGKKKATSKKAIPKKATPKKAALKKARPKRVPAGKAAANGE